MNKVKLALLTVSTCMLTSVSALAGVQNDIPSCYRANPQLGKSSPSVQTELFILIDQTTLLDSRLQNSVRENVLRLIRPGHSFTLAVFSAFAQGRYMEILNSGALEVGLSESDRDTISASALRSFDACLSGQAAYGLKLIQTALAHAFSDSSSSLARSDVMASIKDLSQRVRVSVAKEKIVFIVSDMLENSSISSFYSASNLRLIDPAQELRKAQAAQMIGDFNGARVFVLGAGIVGENTKQPGKTPYRDPKAISALREFWISLLSHSNATVVEFGAPSLLSAVR